MNSPSEPYTVISKKVKKSREWKTIEKFINIHAKVWFREPKGAKIKIFYPGAPWGRSKQEKTLNGKDYKAIHVPQISWPVREVQIKVPFDTKVVYLAEAGKISIKSPPIKF